MNGIFQLATIQITYIFVLLNPIFMHITGDTLFMVIWSALMIFMLTVFYKRGKRALSIFPDINLEIVRYRNRFASGYTVNSSNFFRGGSKNALDIVVTDKELWLKSTLLLAGFARQFDLLHKIPLDKILSADRSGKKISVKFVTDTGQTKEVVLITKNPDKFLRAIKKQAREISQ